MITEEEDGDDSKTMRGGWSLRRRGLGRVFALEKGYRRFIEVPNTPCSITALYCFSLPCGCGGY